MTDETIDPTTLEALAVIPVAAEPTIAEAQAMFADNPGLAWIGTDAGNFSRDGVLVPRLTGE